MMDAALGNTKEYTCPECHGKGIVKLKGQPKYEIVQGCVSMISITINSKDNFVTYTVIAEEKRLLSKRIIFSLLKKKQINDVHF